MRLAALLAAGGLLLMMGMASGSGLMAAVYSNLAAVQWSKSLLAPEATVEAHLRQGETWAQRALRLKPQSAGARALLGRLFQAQSRASEAAHSWRLASEEEPGNSLFRLQLGNAYEEDGDTERALRQWRQVNAFNYFFLRGQVSEEQGG